MTNITYKDFSGGLNYSLSPLELGASLDKVYWEEAKNIRLYKNKGITRMNGNTRISAFGADEATFDSSDFDHSSFGTLGSIYVQGLKGLKVNLNEYLLTVVNGTLYQFDGSEFNFIQKGLDIKEKVTFTPYGQGVIISDGKTEPFIYFPERIETALGNVTVLSGQKTITGSGLGALLVGDLIEINKERHIIATISPSVTTRDNFQSSYSGSDAKLTKVSYLCCNDIYLEFDTEGNPTGPKVTLRSKIIGTWGKRVFIGTDAGYHWSAVGNPSDWQTQYDAGYSYDIGKPILAIDKFRGNLVFYHGKDNGTSILSGSEDPQGWSITLDFSDKGCSSPWGIITNEKVQYFVDVGVFALTPNALGIIDQSEELSKSLRDREAGLLKGRYDQSRADEVIIVNNNGLKELWFFIPIFNEIEFNTIYIFDYVNNAWFRRVVPQNITCATSFDNNVYIGTDDGRILLEESGADFDGENIVFEYYSMFFNFGNEREKEVDEFNLILDKLKDNNFNYSLRTDYNPNVLLDTYTVGASSVDTLIWDIYEWDNYNLAIQRILSQPEQLYGSNKSFSLVFSGIAPMNLAIMGLEFRGISVDQ